MQHNSQCGHGMWWRRCEQQGHEHDRERCQHDGSHDHDREIRQGWRPMAVPPVSREQWN